MSAGKVLVGAVAGFAIGAVAGILFAPEKGSTTRQQIMDKGEDYVGKLKSKFDEFCDTLASKVESTKKDAEDLAQKGKEKFDEVKKETKKAASDIYPSTS